MPFRICSRLITKTDGTVRDRRLIYGGFLFHGPGTIFSVPAAPLRHLSQPHRPVPAVQSHRPAGDQMVILKGAAYCYSKTGSSLFAL